MILQKLLEQGVLCELLVTRVVIIVFYVTVHQCPQISSIFSRARPLVFNLVYRHPTILGRPVRIAARTHDKFCDTVRIEFFEQLVNQSGDGDPAFARAINVVAMVFFLKHNSCVTCVHFFTSYTIMNRKNKKCNLWYSRAVSKAECMAY